jgi:hypothetical protein
VASLPPTEELLEAMLMGSEQTSPRHPGDTGGAPDTRYNLDLPLGDSNPVNHGPHHSQGGTVTKEGVDWPQQDVEGHTPPTSPVTNSSDSLPYLFNFDPWDASLPSPADPTMD